MNHRANRNRIGWSLIEVLVVTAIIAVLAALLFPLLARMKETSNRLICANALRQWGMALTAYAPDNRGCVPRSPGYDWPAAANWSMDADDLGPWPNQFSVGRVIEYLPGAAFDSATRKWNFTAGLYLCPSQKAMKGGGGLWHTSTTWTTYCYFAWSGHWPYWAPGVWGGAVSNLGREQLMGRHLEGANRILMQDLVVDHGAGRGGFHANHMRERRNFGAPSELLGANQLFGDGRVAWKTGAEYDPAGIAARTGQNYASTLPPGWGDVYWW